MNLASELVENHLFMSVIKHLSEMMMNNQSNINTNCNVKSNRKGKQEHKHKQIKSGVRD